MSGNMLEAIKLLKVLARIQRWEVMNSNLLRSSSGRQLYFGLIRHLINEKEDFLIDSMKEIYYDEGIQLTERGVRLSIRSFEADGVIFLEKANEDKRSRKIFLTDKFKEQMLMHANVLKTTLGEDFLVLSK